MKAADLEKLRAVGEPESLWNDQRLVRAMFYGDFGIGKTTLAMEIAKVIGGKVCLITTDSAWTIIQRDEEFSKLVTRYSFDSLPQVRLLIEAHNEKEPGFDFKTIIWDTVSTSIDRVLRDLVKLKPFPNQQVDKSLEGYPHYRMAANSLKETVELLNKSDLHCIYTAHVRLPNEADQNKKRFAIRPNGPNASYEVLGQEVNLIGWLYREGKGQPRKIQFDGTTTETAKSQIPTIPEQSYPVSQIPDLISQWIHNK